MSKIPIISRFSERQEKSVEWLYPDKIPLGTITAVVGKRELGKSTFCFYVAAVVSRGLFWHELPDKPAPKGSVIILTTEDDIDRTIRPRITAAGGDLSKIITIEGFKDTDGEQGLYNLAEDADVLYNAIKAEGDVKLVIIDPLPAYCGKKNENKNAEVRQFLTPLTKIAEIFNLSILGINHLNKDTSKEAANRVLGSVAWGNAIRSELMIVADKQDEGRRLLLPSKSSLTPNKSGLAFKLKSTPVVWDEKKQTYPLCTFEPGIINTTPDSALYEEEKKECSPRIQEVRVWLEDFLGSGPRLATDVFAEAKGLGFASATINRAKKTMGINSHKNGRQSEWSLFG